MPFYAISSRTRVLFSVLFPIMLVCLNQGFDVGAFGTLLYRNVITVWVFVLSMFLGLIYIRFFEGASVKTHRFFILFIPSLWPAIDYLDHHVDNIYVHYFVVFDYFMILFGLLYAAYLFLRLIKADLFDTLTLGNKLFIASMGLTFSALGFILGHHNSVLLECSHFELSGDYVPHNCRRSNHKNSDFRTLYKHIW